MLLKVTEMGPYILPLPKPTPEILNDGVYFVDNDYRSCAGNHYYLRIIDSVVVSQIVFYHHSIDNYTEFKNDNCHGLAINYIKAGREIRALTYLYINDNQLDKSDIESEGITELTSANIAFLMLKYS